MPRLKKPPGPMALDGVAVALAGLLCLELHGVTPAREMPALPPPEVASQTLQSKPRNVMTPQLRVLNLRDTILNRPLFDPTRRPPAVAKQDATAPVDIPRLTGVMITATTKTAVLSPPMGAPIIVRQNSRFGPFTVLAISNDSVTIQGPGGVVVLRSDFSDAGDPENSATRTTVFSGGIYLSLVKMAPPDALNAQGPPAQH